MKKLITLILLLSGLISQAYGESTYDQQETQKMAGFAAWQKQLIWNPASTFDYIYGPAGEIIRPLSGQWFVNANNPAGQIQRMDADNIYIENHLPWVYTHTNDDPLVFLVKELGHRRFIAI